MLRIALATARSGWLGQRLPGDFSFPLIPPQAFDFFDALLSCFSSLSAPLEELFIRGAPLPGCFSIDTEHIESLLARLSPPFRSQLRVYPSFFLACVQLTRGTSCCQSILDLSLRLRALHRVEPLVWRLEQVPGQGVRAQRVFEGRRREGGMEANGVVRLLLL